MEDIKNIKQLLVAADCARTASVQIWDTNNPTTYLGNGEIVITDPQGNVLTGTTALKAVDRIFIQQRAAVGDNVFRSVEIPGNAITGYYCENWEPAAEQVSTLGFNGVSGNAIIDEAVGTLYSLKVIPVVSRLRRDPETFGWRSSNVTVPTASDILLGLAAQINNKAAVDKGLRIKATVLTDSPAVDLLSARTATVIKGSKKVTLSDTDATLFDGDVITIDDVPYVIDSVISNTVFTLTSVYTGASATLLDVAHVTDKSDGNWGLQIEGIPYIYSPGKWNYNKARFNLTVSQEFESKFVTGTPADRGIGTYEQVSSMEWDTKGYFGKTNRFDAGYPFEYPLDASSALTYDLITITWENTETKNIDGNNIQMGSVVIAVPTGALQGDNATSGISTVLNKYIVDQYGVGSNAVLTA